MNTAESCANCEELILGQPVFFDGNAYCCTGCIAGGPCICTYDARPLTEAALVALPASEASRPAYSAPILAAPAYRSAPEAAVTPQRGREPIPFPTRDNGLRAIVLRLGGFRDQRNLLEFALALEDVDALAEVSLTRAEPADAWFAVRAASTQQVVAALQEVRGWLITASASDVYVEGRVESVPAEVARTTEAEPLLPHRARFRVFGAQSANIPVGQQAAPAQRPAEIVALLPETPVAGAQVVAEKLVDVGEVILGGGGELRAGIAGFPDDEVTGTGLIREATEALHFAMAASIRVASRSLLS
ncbi:MAG: hypothetical protein FJ037_04630 [Chloroflexi bacterium]|nr:hypothetical protein [Chloroflexota bacterium]